jgi:ABC-type uncharacterized transport system substrate-binding protein
MAAELVRRRVAVIVAFPIPAAVAAKAATATIPIVFNVAEDPVKLGLVASLARPGGNATGVNTLIAELGAKQLGLLHELVPAAERIGLLVNPINTNAEAVTTDVTAAASAIGVQIDAVHALTAPARADVSEVRVGTKKPAFRSNKETDKGKKCAALPKLLDKKSPIQGVLIVVFSPHQGI